MHKATKPTELNHSGEPYMNNKILYQLFVLMVAFLIFAGCSGGGSSDSAPPKDNVQTGRFIDSAVYGLEYHSASRSGMTNEFGEFKYKAGETVTFTIGGIVIGETQGAPTLTPIDLVDGATDELNDFVINIARFLQTMDYDGNPRNGIFITPLVLYAANGKSVNFYQSIANFENDSNMQAVVNDLTAFTYSGVHSLVSEITAQSHLKDTLSTYRLAGSWGIVHLEGVPESVGGPSGVNADNSVWNFYADGTYDWFFYFDRGEFFFDVNSDGNYALNGNSLSLNGSIVGAVLPGNPTPITFSDNDNQFSVVDDEGDRWTYRKTRATPSTNKPCNNSILIDASHDGGVWWFPQTELTGFSPNVNHQGTLMAGYLRQLGYCVDEIPRGLEVASELLQQYDLVVRFGEFGNYTENELAAYDSYLASSKPLLLVSEHRENDAHDELAEHLGLIFSGAVTDIVKDFTPHAITNDVTEISYNGGAVVLAEDLNESIQVLGSISAGAAMGVLTNQTSKVFFIGDSNDLLVVHQPFVENLFNWLTEDL
jgi:hypothetical protein